MATESPVILTVRLIRSFEHRNIKHVVYKDISLNMTVKQLIEFVKTDIKTRSGLPPPFKTYDYDTLKIQHKKFGAKTSDPAINTEKDDELILKDGATLLESNVESETELSFFNWKDYEKYKENPVISW
ncbi:UPF0538 protein C2orf76 homolog [Acanthaster planci]|uniref:UPF0538 protein C2orf76 homolog n=1 Tax=Acanthaster planci TaxID=133434 RepID=A0A8B7XIX6_ACAPL|nr:UPF0538 protein C2orf76 homolog [Acanthaster planci]XP_022080083.1 UPF0538 protein C2orf76 homolog [Acanthaster planci]